ncbi:MAG: TrmH family RNA methyltransferase [Pirellulaceae bacterium]
MARFEHTRHRPPTALEQPRPITLVVAPLRSAVNLSRMVRLAGCAGITKIVYCGSGKVDPKIARDAADVVTVEVKRSIDPVLKKLKQSGMQMIGLEQTTSSESLHSFRFEKETALVIGSEREGLAQSTLDLLDRVVEIPVYGPPASYNVVTATTMAVYEYCRQFPDG